MKKIIVRKKIEEGQSLLELAMSFLFLMLILGGVFDLGGMFYTFLALRDTAEEGVIYGSFSPTDDTGIIDRIQAAANWPIDSSQISDISIYCCSKDTEGSCTYGTCTTTAYTSCQGQKITVRIIYNYKFIMPVIGGITGWQDFPLNASVTNTILESKPTINALKSMGLSCP
jgi:Flp pilus assembly protein TadG